MDIFFYIQKMKLLLLFILDKPSNVYMHICICIWYAGHITNLLFFDSVIWKAESWAKQYVSQQKQIPISQAFEAWLIAIDIYWSTDRNFWGYLSVFFYNGSLKLAEPIYFLRSKNIQILKRWNLEIFTST